MVRYIDVRRRVRITEEDDPYDEVPRFTLRIAAHLAGVSPALVRTLESRGWIRPKPMRGGGWGYSIRDVMLLRRVREWKDLLGLNMAGVDVALRLYNQVIALQEELALLEAEMRRREQELSAEIMRLRRLLAENGEWQ